MGQIRFFLALWVGKLLIALCRLAKTGGSSLPGRIALRVYPPLLARLSQQASWGSIVISGTNGKTTTAWLLASMMEAGGMRVIHNRTGANLIYGIASTFIAHSSPKGRLEADVNILECDEAAFDGIAQSVRPRAAVVTNFFRDQLDRFGELEHTINMVAKGLAWVHCDGFVVLNADDPAVASLVDRAPARTVFYGVEDTGAGAKHTSDAAESRWCSSCGVRYQYERYYLAHLGVFYCPQCQRRRPPVDLGLTGRTRTKETGAMLSFYYQGHSFDAHLPIRGLYNGYNALAAAATALSMGVTPGTVAEALGQSRASFGRMEHLEVKGRQVIVALIKNPAGCNEVLKTVLEDPGPLHLLIAINDQLADGTDISWLWDADFEWLAHAIARIDLCLASGQRALDMALRLKYAGMAGPKLEWEPELSRALEKALEAVPIGGTLYVLPTYTAMLALRLELNRAGYGRRFWEV